MVNAEWEGKEVKLFEKINKFNLYSYYRHKLQSECRALK